MNLDDLVLLRGWINNLSFSYLDSQLPDDGESASVRIDRLLQGLITKALFYEKLNLVACFKSPVRDSDNWQKKALAGLEFLNKLQPPTPDPSNLISQWFQNPIISNLPSNLHDIGDLAEYLESLHSKPELCPPSLKPSLKLLVKFFNNHSDKLRFSISKSSALVSLSTDLQPVLRFDFIFIPMHLNGERGLNRTDKLSRISASHDVEAIESWLSGKKGNIKTYISYGKELNRFLKWAIEERGKAFSSLNKDDCLAYIQFLKDLTPARTDWVSLDPANRKYNKWKPFVFRQSKISSADLDKINTQPVLSPKSINYAKTVISSCMDWLVKQNYLEYNNFDDISTVKFSKKSNQPNNRAFTYNQIQTIFSYAASKLDIDSTTHHLDRRLLFILTFAFNTGLRIHELAAASFGDIELLDDDDSELYFLSVDGKNSKNRKTSLPSSFIQELKSYLEYRGLPSSFDSLPNEMPIIPNLRDKSGLNHLTPAAIHKALSSFFDEMISTCETDEKFNKRLLSKLKNASAHWLRHTYGSYLVNDKQLPLSYVRDELGHSNISTTSIYVNSEDKKRQKLVSDAFK